MPILTARLHEAHASTPDVLQMVAIRRSEKLFSKAQPAEFTYFLFNGLVKVTNRSSALKSPFVLGLFGSGALVGEEALMLHDSIYEYDADLITDGSLLRIPRDYLSRELGNLKTLLIGRLLEQTLELSRKLELLCLKDVEFRILDFLRQMSRIVPSTQDGFPIPVTQSELAGAICATRETTSTILNQLQRRGLLKLARGTITVLPSFAETMSESQ